MGRPLYIVTDSEPLISAREQKRVGDALLVEARIRKWSPYAFNPDSDEFWQDAQEESFLSTDGLKEQMHEGNRTTSGLGRGGHPHYFPTEQLGPNNPQGPLIDSVSGEELGGVGIDWELVDPASHAISPLASAPSAEERDEGSGPRSPGSYPHPEVIEPDRSLHAYYFFDDPNTTPTTASDAEPRAGASQARLSPLSPVLSYRAWNTAMSQVSDDYGDLDHVLDLDFDDLRLGHQNNAIDANSVHNASNAPTMLPVNYYNHAREEGPNERWVRGPLR